MYQSGDGTCNVGGGLAWFISKLQDKTGPRVRKPLGLCKWW